MRPEHAKCGVNATHGGHKDSERNRPSPKRQFPYCRIPCSRIGSIESAAHALLDCVIAAIVGSATRCMGLFIRKSLSARGNALFLILIAVALFAALSYAVTSSGRGGGGIDRERMELEVVELLQQASSMRTFIQKSQVLSLYDFVQFDDSAENASGTVYLPDGTTKSGRTIGLFNSVTGVPKFYYPEELWEGSSFNDANWYLTYNTRLRVAGSDVGTSAGDIYLSAQLLSEKACQIINQRLHGNPSVPAATFTPPFDRAAIQFARDGTFNGGAGASSRIEDVGVLPGCSVSSGVNYTYYELIQQN